MLSAISDSTVVKVTELIKEGVVSAYQQIQEVAPVLWEMTRTKVIADSVSTLIPICLFFLIMPIWIYISFLYLSGERWKRLYEQNLEPIPVINIAPCITILVVGVIVSAIEGSDAIARLVAIDYYTLQTIVNIIR